jgi:hypothetical protein
MRMATAVPTRRIRDERQTRVPSRHVCDGGCLHQFVRDLKTHKPPFNSEEHRPLSAGKRVSAIKARWRRLMKNRLIAPNQYRVCRPVLGCVGAMIRERAQERRRPSESLGPHPRGIISCNIVGISSATVG